MGEVPGNPEVLLFFFKRERAREIEILKDIVHPLIHSPDDCNKSVLSQAEVRSLEPHLGLLVPWPSSAAFQARSRKLMGSIGYPGLKPNTQKWDVGILGGLTHCTAAPTPGALLSN